MFAYAIKSNMRGKILLKGIKTTQRLFYFPELEQKHKRAKCEN